MVKMVKMINNFTGTDMWVAEDRVEKYLRAGNKLADTAVKNPPEGPKQPVSEAKTPRKAQEPAAPKKAGKKAK